MKNLHEKQKQILDLLINKREGATIDDLVAHLGITKTAVREHIEQISNLGYLTFVDERGDVGRPKRRYLISNEGLEAFPKQYSWLSNVLLKKLAEDMGSEGVGQLMKALADEVAQSMMGKISAHTPSERIHEVVKVLNEPGYRSQIKQSDVRKGAIVEAVNCVYHAVAKEHPELCRFDVRFLEKTSGMSVKLETCIARGASVCRFCFKNK